MYEEVSVSFISRWSETAYFSIHIKANVSGFWRTASVIQLRKTRCMSPSLVCPLFCMSTLLAQRCSKTRRKLLCQIQNIFNQPAMFPAHQNWYLRTSNMLQVVKVISLSWVVQECNLVAWEIAVSVTRDHRTQSYVQDVFGFFFARYESKLRDAPIGCILFSFFFFLFGYMPFRPRALIFEFQWQKKKKAHVNCNLPIYVFLSLNKRCTCG